MTVADLLIRTGPPLWIPILVLRASGKPCICYHPWRDDEGCHCDLPSDRGGDERG